MSDAPAGGVTVTGATGTATITAHERRCGTCLYWRGPDAERRGKCDWARHNLPFSMLPFAVALRTWEDEGGDCVKWGDKAGTTRYETIKITRRDSAPFRLDEDTEANP